MDLNKPLAFRMSPKTLEDYVGQEHILGKDKILYRFELLNENTIIKNYFQTQISIIFIELKSIDYRIINTLNTLINPNIL